MPWAAQRRFIILFIIGAVVVAFSIVVFIAAFSKVPSCTDNTQNQGETGVDCGGPCPYLCRAEMQPPTVLFTTALTNAVGRTDIVASIENKNPAAAAKNVPYTVTLYGAKQILLQKVSGTLDLPPGATETVFIPGAASGKQAVVNAFLAIDPSAPVWFLMPTDTRVVPSVLGATQSGSLSTPRIDAILSNGSVMALTNVQAVVLVRDKQGSVIAASRTVIPIIPGQATATATFTWNSAFPDTPASIEVEPVIPLP